MNPSTPTLTQRPVLPEDEGFLFDLYASTRQEELDAWGWDVHQREVFLQLQHKAREGHYSASYPAAEHQILLVDGQPAGRWMVDSQPERLHLIDIALLPAYRARGLGTSLLRDLQMQAARQGKCIEMHVLVQNLGARRLYERLGFAACGGDPMYLALRWEPEVNR
jgi:ribosomal protein S18 acetylase RimI-like enzyme